MRRMNSHKPLSWKQDSFNWKQMIRFTGITADENATSAVIGSLPMKRLHLKTDTFH